MLLHQKTSSSKSCYTLRSLHQRVFHKKTSMTPERKTQHDCADQRHPGLQNTMRLCAKVARPHAKTCFLLLFRKSDTHETLTRMLRKFLQISIFLLLEVLAAILSHPRHPYQHSIYMQQINWKAPIIFPSIRRFIWLPLSMFGHW